MVDYPTSIILINLRTKITGRKPIMTVKDSKPQWIYQSINIPKYI